MHVFIINYILAVSLKMAEYPKFDEKQKCDAVGDNQDERKRMDVTMIRDNHDKG